MVNIRLVLNRRGLENILLTRVYFFVDFEPEVARENFVCYNNSSEGDNLKTVLITGGSSEIAMATAEEFAKRKYRILLTYFTNQEKTEVFVKKIKEQYQIESYAFFCDLQKEEAIKKLVEEVKEYSNHIDVLINNAAVCYDSLYTDKTKEKFMDTLEVNVVGTFLLSKLVAEEMLQKKKGVIINLSSTNGMNQYYPMSLDYDASKAALLSLTNNLAVAYSPYVRVNAVAPGWIGTTKELEGLDAEYINSECDKIFLKRLGKAEEVAKTIYFLASDDASYINNTVIKVDGGMR